MSSSSSASFGPQIQRTYGALLLGIVVSVGLMGITTLQAWAYYANFPQDSNRLKAMVLGIWLLELIRNTFGVHAVYHYLVINWGNPPALDSLVWSIDANLVLTGLVQTIVHVYFAYRVWVLSRHKRPLVILISFLAFGNLAMTIATYGATVAATSVESFTGNSNLPTIFSDAGLAFAILADWMITVSLAYLLNLSRENIPTRTEAVLKKLIFYSVNIGLVTSVADIAVLTLSVVRVPPGDTMYYFAVYEVVGNLYANSLLATLNARTNIQKQWEANPVVEMSTIRIASNPGTRASHHVSAVYFPNPLTSAIAESTDISSGVGSKDARKSFAETNKAETLEINSKVA